jgi:Ni,Fe-hydrogenase III small subunit
MKDTRQTGQPGPQLDDPDPGDQKGVQMPEQGAPGGPPQDGASEIERTGAALRLAAQRLFRRSLHVRQVDAGSCNACEFEVNSLTGPFYDLQRFGIDIVASPRHADLLLVTGPVTRHLRAALLDSYAAMPEPRLVAAMGVCAIHGGVFAKSYAVEGPLDRLLPVDVYIPGCPPRPQAILHGLLLLLGRTEARLVGGVWRPRPGAPGDA